MATSNPRTVFHVAARDGKWHVTRERRPEGEFDSFETQAEAVERARSEAQNQAPSVVKVHAPDGSREDDFTFARKKTTPPSNFAKRGLPRKRGGARPKPRHWPSIS